VLDGLLVGPELGAMDQGDLLGDGFEGDRPVDGRIAAADDDDLLVPEVFDPLGEVVDALAFQIADARCLDPLRLEGADPGADDDGLAVALGDAGAEADDAVGQDLQAQYLFAEPDGGFGAQGLLVAGIDEV